jgi:hypothetical protein
MMSATFSENMKFPIGENCSMLVGKSELIIRDECSHKFASLTLQRSARLRAIIPDIDQAIGQILKQEKGISYRRHIGGRWFVSVSSGVWCVDIRKYLNIVKDDPDELDIRPTRCGIGIRLSEWSSMKEAMEAIYAIRPDIAETMSCMYGEDHQNQEGILTTFII